MAVFVQTFVVYTMREWLITHNVVIALMQTKGSIKTVLQLFLHLIAGEWPNKLILCFSHEWRI